MKFTYLSSTTIQITSSCGFFSKQHNNGVALTEREVKEYILPFITFTEEDRIVNHNVVLLEILTNLFLLGRVWSEMAAKHLTLGQFDVLYQDFSDVITNIIIPVVKKHKTTLSDLQLFITNRISSENIEIYSYQSQHYTGSVRRIKNNYKLNIANKIARLVVAAVNKADVNIIPTNNYDIGQQGFTGSTINTIVNQYTDCDPRANYHLMLQPLKKLEIILENINKPILP